MKKPLYRRKSFLFSVVPLALLLVWFVFLRGGKGEINALVFSYTEGFRHDSIEPGIEAIKQLGETHDFTVEATENPEIFNEASLKRFNVVIFLNTTGDILTDNQRMYCGYPTGSTPLS